MNTANNIIVVTYLTYLLISVALTIWVARTLYKRGAIFLVDAFHGDRELADSVNHLLVVGFYLINIGFVSLALKTAEVINNSRSAIELLSDKMGMVLLILGGMHFFNLYVFSRIRRSARVPRPPVMPPPPVAPDARLNVAIPR
ncbi:MAG: hypothetical protein LAP86_07040 [Acidobacteriia bacterium]|nr:hypothetical protein [Terriglobia bacterium]